MKIQQDRDYVRLFHLILTQQDEKIARYFPNEVISKFVSLKPEALERWHSSLSFIERAEKMTGFPFHLSEKNRLHALDAIVTAEILRIPTFLRSSAIEAYCLYYLSVHILDDFIEDINKFAATFTYSDSQLCKPTAAEMNVAMLGFIFHANMAISNILQSDPEQFSPEKIVKLQNLVCCSLASQIQYFLREKDTSLTALEVAEIKQWCVSAEATSTISDFLQIDKNLDPLNSIYFKEMLRSLGTLTQFTDDLRDYEEDKANGNSNLLVAMEKIEGERAIEKLVDWYVEEEDKMRTMLRLSEISLEEELLFAVPWYPFFLR